jgi:hypothetical protein
MVWDDARRIMPGRTRGRHAYLVDIAVAGAEELVSLCHYSPQGFCVRYGVRIEFDADLVGRHRAEIDLHTKCPLVSFLAYL